MPNSKLRIKLTTTAQSMDYNKKPTINYMMGKQWHIIHTFYYYHAALPPFFATIQLTSSVPLERNWPICALLLFTIKKD